MARVARKQSETGIYHIMLRGNNRQQIFLDDEDNETFIGIIKEYKVICNFSLLAYCLMGNHIHILIKTNEIPVANIMKRIVVKFVYYYNIKYSRVGHLFQDRFKSEPVENDEYLFQVVRYIHQNPLKAGICNRIDEYKYSSYNDYMVKGNNKNILTDTDFILEMMPLSKLKKYHLEIDSEFKCIDIAPISIRVSDVEAIKIINDVLRVENIEDLKQQHKLVQMDIAKQLKNKGLSIRQISRITGISKRIVELS